MEDSEESFGDCALQDVDVHEVVNLEDHQANFPRHLSTAAAAVSDGGQVTEDMEQVVAWEVNLDSASLHLVA